MKEYFFYRDFGKTTFTPKDIHPSSLKYIVVKTFSSSDEKKVFCPLCYKWNSVLEYSSDHVVCSCGNKIDGYVIEEPIIQKKVKHVPMYHISDSLWNSLVVGEKKYIDTLHKKSCHNSIESKNSPYLYEFDSEGGNKRIFAFAVLINENSLSMKIFKYYLKKTEDKKIFNKIPYDTIEEFYYLKNNLYKSYCGPSSVDLESIDLPFSAYTFLEEEFKQLVNKMAGKMITYNTHLKGKQFLYQTVHFPYEPNLFYYYRDYDLSSIQNDPDCYNKFCNDYLHIKSYKTLRKLFATNPEVLAKYKNICDNKIWTDINIINEIIASKDSDFLINSYVLEDIVFYSQKCHEYNKCERTIWNNLKKGFFLEDCLRMFRMYYSYIDESFKKKFLLEGGTEYNHNILSKIGTRVDNMNIEFTYSPEEKNLEDFINGYEFKLPVDSYMLRDIGDELSNCVYSYKMKVKNKDCLIVYAIKSGKIEMCIEIRGKEIYQHFGPRNDELNPEQSNAFEIWRKKHNLVVV